MRNWINRYLAHETWFERMGRWSPTGQKRLRSWLKQLPRTDDLVIGQKLDELSRLEEQLGVALKELLSAYGESVAARRLDAIKGVDVVSAISMVARIGPVERFPDADGLIAYAGLAPGFLSRTRPDETAGSGAGGPIRTCGIT